MTEDLFMLGDCIKEICRPRIPPSVHVNPSYAAFVICSHHLCTGIATEAWRDVLGSSRRCVLSLSLKTTD